MVQKSVALQWWSQHVPSRYTYCFCIIVCTVVLFGYLISFSNETNWMILRSLSPKLTVTDKSLNAGDQRKRIVVWTKIFGEEVNPTVFDECGNLTVICKGLRKAKKKKEKKL